MLWLIDHEQFGYLRMVFDTKGISAKYHEQSWLMDFQMHVCEYLQKVEDWERGEYLNNVIL